MTRDLATAILINESKTEQLAGDVGLFKDARRAAEALEAIDVQNGEYFAYRLDGTRLRIAVESGTIVFIEESGLRSIDVVRDLLTQTAKHTISARSARSGQAAVHSDQADLTRPSTGDLARVDWILVSGNGESGPE
jgi:hypothetical protein